jgi:hypothetical protein
MSQFPDETNPRADSQKGAAAPAPDAPPALLAITEAEQQASTALAELPAERRAVIVLDSPKHELALRDLVKQSADITIVNSPDGREQAHRMAMNLRKARTTIDNRGKEVRDDANKFSRAVIAEVNRLLTISAAEEERIFALRDAYDAEQKRIAAEAAAKEAARVQGHKDTIANMLALPVDMVNASAAELEDELAGIEELVMEGFTALEEFAEEALQAAGTVRQTLTAMHAAAVAREQMAAQLAEQQRLLAEQQRQMQEAQAALAAQQAELDRRAAALAEQEAAAAPPAAEPPLVDDDHAPAGWESIEADESPADTLAGAITGAMDDATCTQRPDAYTYQGTSQEAHTTGLEAAGFSEAGLARVAEAVKAAPASVQLRFEGYSDDTFGEYLLTGDDFDNCASGAPIRWRVTHPDVLGGVIVVGQYAPGDASGWLIGVVPFSPGRDDVPLPAWPMWFERGEFAYSPALYIEAPEGVEVTCLERA